MKRITIEYGWQALDALEAIEGILKECGVPYTVIEDDAIVHVEYDPDTRRDT